MTEEEKKKKKTTTKNNKNPSASITKGKEKYNLVRWSKAFVLLQTENWNQKS